MKIIISLFTGVFVTSVVFSQADLDKPLRLTGTGADAKIEGIKDISQPQDAVSAEAVQKSSLVFDGSASGAADAYTATLVPTPASLTPGILVMFVATANNTGAATINVNGLGAIALKKDVSADLEADDIKAGQIISAIYDGTNFQVLSRSEGSGGGAGAMDYTHLYLDTFH
ncbi:MAG: hypothetical protein IT223_04890 [Crocinitomicaceae bacterium]|nr:hypothetical protein [Crocinitomicaceae bacterium]